MEHQLMINSIANGTTIDHIPAGKSLEIIKFLKIDPKASFAIAVNVPSTILGKKDLIFIDDFELSENEIKKIGLFARNITVNIIRNKKIAKKYEIGLPEKVEGIVKCINPNCISSIEQIPTKFNISQNPISGQCFYCEKTMNEKELINALK